MHFISDFLSYLTSSILIWYIIDGIITLTECVSSIISISIDSIAISSS